MTEERRYPLLVAFVRQSLVDVADEAIDQFDRCLADAHQHARRDLDEARDTAARATNEMIQLLGDLGDQRLYCLDRGRTYPNLEPRLKGRIRRDLIWVAGTTCCECLAR